MKHLNFKTGILTTLLTVVACVFTCTNAATRYVSHSGSNTFPYTTWETAANTIEAANLATLPGDTMFVDTGSFYLSTEIFTQPNIVIRGKGMDSTTVLGSDAPEVLHFALFQPEDSNYFEDIHFIGHGSHYALVKLAGDPWRSLFCHRCKFSGFNSTVISCNQTRYVEIKDCWFETWGIYALSLTERGDYVIENNTFNMANAGGEIFDFFGHIGTETIRNNIFLGGGASGLTGDLQGGWN